MNRLKDNWSYYLLQALVYYFIGIYISFWLAIPMFLFAVIIGPIDNNDNDDKPYSGGYSSGSYGGGYSDATDFSIAGCI